jgi:hypothetical protein
MTQADNTVACRFVTRAPMSGPSLESACHLGRIWLDACNTSHMECHSTIGSKLPTRILQLFGNVEAPTIKFIETRGIEGARYCSLSHRWRPIDRMPLRNTRENYDTHVTGISYE